MFASASASLQRPSHALPPQHGISEERLRKLSLKEQLSLTHGVKPSAPLMQGSFSVSELREGLSLLCCDVVHLADLTSQFLVEKACIKVLLKLEGPCQVAVGRHMLPLDEDSPAHSAAQGAFVSIRSPECLTRHARAGSKLRMVAVTLSWPWLQASGMPLQPFQKHLSLQRWQPSRRAVSIAEQLLHPLERSGPLHQLQQESRALELVIEAFGSQQSSDMPAVATQPESVLRRVRQLQDLLDSGVADNMNLQAIARKMGCNANTLQQQFRQVSGQTIAASLRQRRLQRAALALQHEGASVGQAAELAGYSSQANFSTAFRRLFGVMPKHYRNRL